MNSWIKKLSVLGVAGVVYVVGQYFRGIWFENLPLNPCEFGVDQQGIFCNSPYVDVGFALIDASEIFAIVGVILLFANENGMRAWWRFSRWYVPIATLLVILIGPVNLSPLGLLSGGEGSVEPVVWLFGSLYILFTLGIVLRGLWHGRATISPAS